MRQSICKSVVTSAILISFLTSASYASDWWESIKVKGDLRYRHEMIDKEDKATRNRHRVRARVSVSGRANDMFKVAVQFATGSDDPVSTNQTLDGGFSTKDIRLDLAYFDFVHDELPGLNVTGGKFKNPFFKPGGSELVWDSDWNPEGGVAHYGATAEIVNFKLTGAGLWIDERSSSEDSYITAAQGVVGFDLGGSNKASLGASYFGYVNAEGYETFFDSEDPKGNSTALFVHDTDTLTGYANGFEIIELLAESSHKLNNTPVTLLADFVKNTAADSLNTGWLVGVKIGRAKERGTWAFRYNYRKVERDAVLGMFTDSDFRGGGTDAKGHEIGGTYQVEKNAAFSVSFFANDIGLEAAESVSFNRLQVDLQLKF